MKYAERQADLSTFMLGVEPGRESITIDYFVWLLFFPNATFCLQIKEYQYWTGPVMRFRAAQGLVEANDMAELVRLNMQRRVHFVDGRAHNSIGI